jgi:superfamily II DNA or RNA helicase
MAIFIALKYHGKTMIVVHKEDLMNQWIEEINSFTNNKNEAVSILNLRRFFI